MQPRTKRKPARPAPSRHSFDEDIAEEAIYCGQLREQDCGHHPRRRGRPV